MDEKNLLHKELAYRIIGVAMQVHRELGHGFMEKVYENAMMVLMKREGIKAVQQIPITVMFLNEIVSEYIADIFVDDKVLCELKSVERISNAHRAQALNYLKATGLDLALILNFGKEKLEFERLVLQPKSSYSR